MMRWRHVSDAARSAIKTMIVDAALARIISPEKAQRLLARLGLRDA